MIQIMSVFEGAPSGCRRPACSGLCFQLSAWWWIFAFPAWQRLCFFPISFPLWTIGNPQVLQKSLLKNCLELLCLQDRDKNKELIQGHVALQKQVTLALCGAYTDQLGVISDMNFIVACFLFCFRLNRWWTNFHISAVAFIPFPAV